MLRCVVSWGAQASQRGQLMLMMRSDFGGPSFSARAADAHDAH